MTLTHRQKLREARLHLKSAWACWEAALLTEREQYWWDMVLKKQDEISYLKMKGVKR